ncbi:MAG: flagellar protein [Nitrosomonadales bacterium]|nr:MAG: flagellar protein [Nitrosomonadales bacterium]
MMQISQVGSSVFSSSVQGEPGAQRVAVPETARPSSAAIELPAKAVQAAKETVNPSSLKQATEKLNQAMRMMASNLQFTVDEETGIDVVKVVDSDTKEVIRQFPSEEVLAIAKAFDQLQGLLVRDKA